MTVFFSLRNRADKKSQRIENMSVLKELLGHRQPRFRSSKPSRSLQKSLTVKNTAYDTNKHGRQS